MANCWQHPAWLIRQYNLSTLIRLKRALYRVPSLSKLLPDLIGFRRLTTRHQLKTVGLFQIDVDSLNHWMRKAVVRVNAQSESELYYYEGSIMKKGKEFSIEYPNQLRFLQLETDNRTTEAQLKLLKIDYRAALRTYSQKVLELTELKHKLSREQSRKAVSDYDEGNRREAVIALSKKVDSFVMPVPPDWLRYETEKDMLELRLQNNKRLNASLLIWQALDAKN